MRHFGRQPTGFRLKMQFCVTCDQRLRYGCGAFQNDLAVIRCAGVHRSDRQRFGGQTTHGLARHCAFVLVRLKLQHFGSQLIQQSNVVLRVDGTLHQTSQSLHLIVRDVHLQSTGQQSIGSTNHLHSTSLHQPERWPSQCFAVQQQVQQSGRFGMAGLTVNGDVLHSLLRADSQCNLWRSWKTSDKQRKQKEKNLIMLWI